MTFRYKGNSFGGIVNYLKQIDQLDDIIKIDVSNQQTVYYKEYIFYNGPDHDHWVSGDGDNEYVIFSFNSIKPILTHYSIRSHSQEKFYLRSWIFSGSNDKENWIELHSKSGSNDLQNFNVKTYKVNNPLRTAYRYYRIKKTGKM